MNLYVNVQMYACMHMHIDVCLYEHMCVCTYVHIDRKQKGM